MMMTVNIFAGSRRVALVMGVLWVIGVLFGNYSSYTPSILYSIEDPNSPPTLVLSGGTGKTGHLYCSIYDYLEREWTNTSVFDGTYVDVHLCIKTKEKAGWRYVGFPRADGTIGAVVLDKIFDDSLWKIEGVTDEHLLTRLKESRQLGERYIENQIAFVKNDLARDSVRTVLRADARKERLYQIKEYVSTVLIAGVSGLVVLYVFVFGVGWIVRGFMGIPRGMDFKPTSTSSHPEPPT